MMIENEIQRLNDEFVIEQDDAPSANDPDRVVNVINSESLAKVLGYKGKKVCSVDYSKLQEKKIEGISKLCMVTIDKVKELVNKSTKLAWF